MNFLKIGLSCVFLLGLVSCNEKPVNKSSQEHIKEIVDWHSKRISNLKKETGWLNLVGLFWLDEGINTFGSSDENSIVFPKNAPIRIGQFTKIDSVIIFESSSNAVVKTNGENVTKIVMKPDISGEPTILENGSLRWFIIKRGDKYGIRLRDLNADLLQNFEGIERFPTVDKWKITAKFEKFDPPQKIIIPNILGTVSESLSPGKLIFSIDGKEYNLSPTSSGAGLFIVFADLTSGEETYGAGRFLYVDGPDSNNNVIIDFNKAYNPPCAFTKFATCPLPPDENKLRVRIEAGEKNYSYGH